MFKKWKKTDPEETRQEGLERQERDKRQEKQEKQENSDCSAGLDRQENQEKQEISNSSDNSDGSDNSDNSDGSDSGLKISREAERGFISEITDEEFEAAEALASEIRGTGGQEEISETLQELFLKAVCYDRAVAEAETHGEEAGFAKGEEAGFAKGEEAGEIKGRNASIEELTRLEIDDDGLPHPCGRTGSAHDAGSIFDLARLA